MNKVVVITGISSGIGEALVKEVLNTFSNTIVIGLGRNNSDNLLSVNNYEFIELNISKYDAIAVIFTKIIKKYGKIDVLINNAGAGVKGTIEDMSIDEAKHEFDVNFWGAIGCIKAVLPVMTQQNAGHIINISSLGSIIATPTLGFYAGAKSALNIVSDTLVDELKGTNIKISNVFPGAVKTKFGKNIQPSANLQDSKYSCLYYSWDKRFRSYFRKAISSQEMAKKIVSLINNPKTYLFPTKRDQFIAIIKKLLPEKIFKAILLNIFFKE